MTASIFKVAGRYAFVGSRLVYAFTAGLRSPRYRHVVTTLARQLGYTGDIPGQRLPQLSIAESTSPWTPVVLGDPVPRDGSVTALELVTIARLVRERNPRSVFEIGTFDGRTTLALAANSEATVYTLDLPANAPAALPLDPFDRPYIDKPTSGARFHGTRVAPRIRQLYGDSATFDFSPYEADLVFVDGSHSYEYVQSDSQRALALLPGGKGTILWHDYAVWPGVTLALEHLAATDPRFRGIRWIEGTTLAILVS